MSGPESPTSNFGFIQLQAAAAYKYEPLPGINYIRRAKLHPGTFEDAIVISLEVVPFSEDQRPEYEALSYVWGSAEQPGIVRVDEKYGLTISATRNLITALKYLRRTDQPRVLWIDALCINQTDDVEKGPQVGMMGDIYRHATRVVVWLGPEAENSDLIMAKMESLGSQIQVNFHGKVTISLAGGASDPDLDHPFKYDLWLEEMEALVHLLLRPWFRRLWIRQEIQLASPAAVITCGHSQVPWPVFLRTLVLVCSRPVAASTRGPITEPGVHDRVKVVTDQLSKIIKDLEGFFSAGYDTLLMCELRRDFASAECYDPRDRIYGVLSLLPDNISKGLVPDYTKPFGDVYKDAFLRYIRTTRDLSLLGSCELGTGSQMPSWVPDWSRKFKCPYGISPQLASSQISAWYELHANDVLRVTGVLVGTIQHHDGFRLQLGWGHREIYEELRRLLMNMIHPEKTIVDDKQIDYVARTLLCNHFSDAGEPPFEMFPTIESGKNIIQKMLSGVDQSNPSIFTEDDIGKFFSMALYNIGMQILKTTDGQFAVAPPQAQPGDQICVLLGCENPMILRPAQDGKFLVVSSCFMQNVNGGESLLGPLPGHMRPVLFQEMMTRIWKDSRTGLLSYVDPRLKSLNVIPNDILNSDFKGRRTFNVHSEFLRDLGEQGVEIRYFDLV